MEIIIVEGILILEDERIPILTPYPVIFKTLFENSQIV